ncbi:MAG: hypothetical protein KDJ28_04765 [Candidatus Competibacteraceae bacterium]|nr:hypothetical protein [Candidatus Competibacteraceae bacterium]
MLNRTPRVVLSFAVSLSLIGFVDCAYSARDEEPLPEFHRDFIGDWVPKKSPCKSALRFRVGPKRVVLMNGQESKSIRIQGSDYCISCGGLRPPYEGITVWLLPGLTDSEGPGFEVRFNADEKLGITMLDMEPVPELARRFPLDGIELRKCKRSK